MDYILMGAFALCGINISKAENDFWRRWHNDLSCSQGWHPTKTGGIRAWVQTVSTTWYTRGKAWQTLLLSSLGVRHRHGAGRAACSSSELAWWKPLKAGCSFGRPARPSDRQWWPASVRVVAACFVFTQTEDVCTWKRRLMWTLVAEDTTVSLLWKWTSAGLMEQYGGSGCTSGRGRASVDPFPPLLWLLCTPRTCPCSAAAAGQCHRSR